MVPLVGRDVFEVAGVVDADELVFLGCAVVGTFVGPEVVAIGGVVAGGPFWQKFVSGAAAGRRKTVILFEKGFSVLAVVIPPANTAHE